MIGPSGVEYALTQWWREARTIAEATSSYMSPTAIDQVLAVSGSASLQTARQIDAAIKDGFLEIAIDPSLLQDEETCRGYLDSVVMRTVAILEQGRSAILHTARGPSDPRISRMLSMLTSKGLSREQARHSGGRHLGQRMGEAVAEIVARFPVKRLLLAGGDTSSQIAQHLEIDALEVAARICPGVPLCRARAVNGKLDGLEIAFKGGQLGEEGFFNQGRVGTH